MSAQHRTIPSDAFRVEIGRSAAGKLEVCVQLDPRNVPDLAPGRYEGSLQISGPRVEATAVPIAASFRDSHVRPIIVAAIGTAIGVILKALEELASGRGRRVRFTKFRDYAETWAFAGSVLAAPLFAAAAYYSLYAPNASWGADPSDTWKLLTACVAYQIGGATLISVIAPGGNVRVPGAARARKRRNARRRSGET